MLRFFGREEIRVRGTRGKPHGNACYSGYGLYLEQFTLKGKAVLRKVRLFDFFRDLSLDNDIKNTITY